MKGGSTEEFAICPALVDDAAAIAKVHVDTWRSQYRGIVAQHYLDALSYEQKERMWRSLLINPQRDWHLLVARERRGQAIGFCSFGRDRSTELSYDSELYALYLLEEYQLKGIGKQLLLRALCQLHADRFKSCTLWILKQNPSRGFYEAMGACLGGEKWVDIAGESYQELRYSWSDLTSVLRSEKERWRS